jgi:hypothetical protein
MVIEFMRASTPSDLRPENCSLCGQAFQTRSVIAVAMDRPEGWQIGVVCPSCIRNLGEHAPEQFPSIQEYQDALRRYPRPIWASVEEADAELDAPGWEVPDLWRVERSA